MSLYYPTNAEKRRSPYWSAQFRGPAGRVVSVGTKLRDRRTAKRLEAVWVRAAELGRNGHLTIDRAKGLLCECAEICRGDSLQQSERFIDSCLRQSTGAVLNLPTVENYFRDWLASKQEVGRNSQGTLDRYGPVLERFLSYLTDVRRRNRLDSVTPMDCQGFLRSERKRGISAVSANQSVKILRIVFNSARRQGLIGNNPADAVDLLHENPDKREPFGVDQVRSILDMADPEWKGLIMLGFYAGLRLGDAAKLTWGNLDLEHGLLIFQAQKTARRKKGDKNTVIDLHRDLWNYFGGMQPGVPAAPVFPSLCHRPIGSASGLSARFKRLMDKAGVLSPLGAPNGSGRVFRALSFHSLRHSFVSQLSNAGVAIEVRKELAGHSSDAISLGYTHVSRTSTAAAVNQIPSLKVA
jgi:integrase